MLPVLIIVVTLALLVALAWYPMPTVAKVIIVAAVMLLMITAIGWEGVSLSFGEGRR